MPFFSVIIPTYNRFKMTQRAIESVLNQTFTDFELIVIDDGSTDDTFRLEDLYKDKIQYISQDNKGVSAARNRGIQAGEADYIAFLDSDDQWLLKKLEFHKLYLEENSHCFIHQTSDIWRRNGLRINPRKKHIKKTGNIFKESLQLCMISPSAVMIHKKLFNTYGVFDESLPACEDYDLWLTITAHENIGLISDPLIVRYAGHSDQLSQNFWGMDRFRIYAILKLIKMYHDTLVRKNYMTETKTVLNKKINILYNGAVKRNNTKLAKNLQKIHEIIIKEDYRQIDYAILLEE